MHQGISLRIGFRHSDFQLRHVAKRHLEFLHFGLSAKNHLRTALARLRERGDPGKSGWVRDSLILHEENNPLTPGFAVPYLRGEGCYQLRSRGANAEKGGAFSPAGVAKRHERLCGNRERARLHACDGAAVKKEPGFSR